MANDYLWQGIPNQAYGKYEKGIVGPASREALDGAVNFHAGDGKTTTLIEVLDRPTHINNRWGGFGTDYHMNAGDLRMTYGEQPLDWMDTRWKKYAERTGKTSLLDQAGSVDVRLMETTHRDATTGEYLVDRLRTPGTKVAAIKDANIGVKIPTADMTHILSSEALAKGAAATELKPGMIIASDALGVYSPPLKSFLKKNQPVDEIGKAVHSKLSKFLRIQETAMDYAKQGFIKESSAQKYIKTAWNFVVKWGSKIR